MASDIVLFVINHIWANDKVVMAADTRNLLALSPSKAKGSWKLSAQGEG